MSRTLYLEERGQADVIYTGFDKAFDKVTHDKWINTLGSNGIEQALVKWARTFLLHRKHRVSKSDL